MRYSLINVNEFNSTVTVIQTSENLKYLKSILDFNAMDYIIEASDLDAMMYPDGTFDRQAYNRYYRNTELFY